MSDTATNAPTAGADAAFVMFVSHGSELPVDRLTGATMPDFTPPTPPAGNRAPGDQHALIGEFW